MNKIFILLFLFGTISGALFISMTDFLPTDDENVETEVITGNVDPHDELIEPIQEEEEINEKYEGEKAPHYSNNKQLFRALKKIKSMTTSNGTSRNQFHSNESGLPPAPPVHPGDSFPGENKDDQYHLNALYSDDAVEIREGMKALAKSKNQRAIASIAEKVWDKRGDLSIIAIKSLKEIDEDAYREVLLTAIEDSDVTVQEQALVGMAKTKFPRTKEYLERFLDSPSSELQLAAIGAMVSLNDKSYIGRLQKISLESKNPKIKARAELAVFNLLKEPPK